MIMLRRVIALMYNYFYCRLDYKRLHRIKMLKLFSSMQYFCVLAILQEITTEISGSHVDNGIRRYSTFNMDDFLELFVLKPILIEYVLEMSTGVSRNDLIVQAGVVGEEL